MVLSLAFLAHQLPCADAKRQIKRAKAHKTGEDKDQCQKAQYNRKPATDKASGIEPGYGQCKDEAYDAVSGSHVLFHNRELSVF